MAFDTVIDKTQLETEMAATANAIREKSGDTSLIDWISGTGFAEAIAALDVGGKQIERIVNTAGQYIDTGFFPDGDTRMVLDFEILTVPSSSKTIIGSREDTKTNTFILVLASGTNFRDDYNKTQKSISGVSVAGRHLYDKNKNVTTIDGVTVNHTKATFSTGYSAYIFTTNDAGSVHSTTGVHMAVYSCQIYDNGTLVRDFVPWVTADGEAGLKDKLSGVFYHNCGTGQFTT